MDYTKLKPAECASCPLHKAPGPCWGEGDPQHARLIYIAQNPGEHETDTQPYTPLRGPSGRVFNRQLFEANIPRSDLFVTNQVKCRTPNNREPTPAEVACCRPLLNRELERCKSDTVVLAGAVAFKENIGSFSTLHPRYRPSDSIFERMGCVEQRNGRKWIGTIHPAFVMRMPDFRLEATEHLRKAWAISGITIPLPTVLHNPTEVDVERHRAAARKGGMFADDVEAINMPKDIKEDDYVGAEWDMDMCGFSAIPYEAIVLPRDRVSEWNDVFLDPKIMQCEHNGEYDRYHLEKICEQNNVRYDTMLGHHWLHNNVHKYLKPECVRYYTNLPYYERDIESVDRNLYCGLDNITTYLAARSQIRELKREELWELFWTLGMPILPVLEKQRRVGMRVDIRKALLYHKITLAKVEQAEGLISKLVGPTFNWKSWIQKRDLWYNVWKLPPQYNLDKKTRQKKLTTDDDARINLVRWIKDPTHPERVEKHKPALQLFTLIDFVSENKKLSEYFDRISPDMRIHAHQKAHADTYRIKTKPNVQNWPTWPIAEGYDSLRSIIIPDDDEDLFISTDFDQIELWTYAAQFDIKWLLDVYNKGDYIYGAVFEDVFKRPFFEAGKPHTKKYRLASVTDQDLLRAKAIPIGFLYARSGESVAAEHNWPAKDGVKYRREWLAKVPELQKAHDWIQYEMSQKGRLRPPPGVILHYPQPILQGLNCFGQTPAALMLYKCMIETERAFKRRGLKNTRTVLSVHDSILFNIGGAKTHPQNLISIYEEDIRPILTQHVPWLKGFQYRHSAKVGTMWDWKMIDYEDWKAKVCG